MSAAPAAPVRQAQHLLFAVGDLRCSLELARLEAIVPWVTLRGEGVPQDQPMPKGWLGWMDHRGQSVPVVDAEQLVFGSATERHLGARILLLQCAARMVGVVVSDAVSIGYAADIAGSEVERFDPCDVMAAMLSGVPA